MGEKAERERRVLGGRVAPGGDYKEGSQNVTKKGRRENDDNAYHITGSHCKRLKTSTGMCTTILSSLIHPWGCIRAISIEINYSNFKSLKLIFSGNYEGLCNMYGLNM